MGRKELIERFYLKEYLSFKEVELNLACGLVVFTGPSGSGKSILMNSILSSLGASGCEATLCESSVTWNLDAEEKGIENDEINIFKHIKKEKSRYFINNQSISKKTMSEVSSNYLRHLSLKDYSDFENSNLISILDLRIQSKFKNISKLKDEYLSSFNDFVESSKKLEKLNKEEGKLLELKEFLLFEIKKIEDVNPVVSEDEELLKIKKELSKKEKVLENISSANSIFDYEHYVFSALDSLDIDSTFFNDAMNELRVVLDNAQERFSALDDVDVEDVLNRIEEISSLKKRYGSIEEALAYRQMKKDELAEYENIEFIKDDLEKRCAILEQNVRELADKMSALRHAELSPFTKDLNRYLKELYLREAEVKINETEYNSLGKDEIILKLNNTELQKVSTGEFNRLRLAILALKSEHMSQNGGVLMLDEIDANLSGEESMSVAKVLRQLSKHFQIFVISHQPQLTSMGDQHFLIYKEGDESFAKELDFESKVDEIARIISGESVSNEAKKFAKELLEANKCVL
ncbi:MAG: AAA family ATPase [Sulfurimonas sp.]|nr:AAA family ATPase [Sulfurimonas sp.]